MITIACVLRSGGIYTPGWVWALKRGLGKHLPLPFQLMVLTDIPDGFGPWGLPLKHNWPGWWSKIELFRPGLFDGPVLYLDLDTLPVGDLTEIARAVESWQLGIAMLSDFYRPDHAESGVMLIHPTGASQVYEEFVKDPVGRMQQFRADGRWIEAMAPGCTRLQSLVPDQIVSLKVHARSGPPAGARLVCAHGRPKFTDPAAGWAYDAWRAA